jgi:hypothetical protein
VLGGVCQLILTQFCSSESIVIINSKYKNQRIQIINQLLGENDKAKMNDTLAHLSDQLLIVSEKEYSSKQLKRK